MAAFLGTDHHERTFSAETVYELLPDVARWLDEPFGDASVLPTHLLSRFARESVKVILGGDGADELIAGYPTFAAERAAALFRRLPAAARSMAGAAVGRLPVDHGNFSLDFRLKQFVRGARRAAGTGTPAMAGLVLRARKSRGCSPAALPAASTSRPSISPGPGASRPVATR